MAENWMSSVKTSPVVQKATHFTRRRKADEAVGKAAAAPIKKPRKSARNKPGKAKKAESGPAREGTGAAQPLRIGFQAFKPVLLQESTPLRPAWGDVFSAVQDTVFAKDRPAVVKNCSKSTYHLLKNALVNQRSTLVLRVSFPAEIGIQEFKTRLLALGEEIAQLPEGHPATVQVYWDADTGGTQTISLATLLGGGMKSALAAKEDDGIVDEDAEDADEDGEGEDGKTDDAGDEGLGAAGKLTLTEGLPMLQGVLATAHPEHKLVIFTPAAALKGSKAQNACETFDANALGYKLDQDGYEHKVAKLHAKHQVKPPLQETLRALKGVAYKDLGGVFRDATLVAARRAATCVGNGGSHSNQGNEDNAPHSVPALAPALQHLHMANARLHNRAAGDTEEARKHLQQVPNKEAALLQQAPKAVRDFCDLVRHYDEVHALAPHTGRGLLLEGDRADGKEGLARSVAAAVGKGFLFAPDRTELLAMVASGKGKGLTKFLTDVNTFAHQQDVLGDDPHGGEGKTYGVVYLADLAELLQTVDRVSEQGLLVRGLLAKLLGGLGSEVDRDRIVLVAAANDAEALGDDLALRFGTRAFVKPACQAERLQLWRSELTDQCNAALSDGDLATVLDDARGFARSDVQQAIALAAQHAVSHTRSKGGTSSVAHLTADDLLVGIAAHARTRRQPEWLRAYS